MSRPWVEDIKEGIRVGGSAANGERDSSGSPRFAGRSNDKEILGLVVGSGGRFSASVDRLRYAGKSGRVPRVNRFSSEAKKSLTSAVFAITLSRSIGPRGIRRQCVVDVPLLRTGHLAQKKATFRVGRASIRVTRVNPPKPMLIQGLSPFFRDNVSAGARVAASRSEKEK